MKHLIITLYIHFCSDLMRKQIAVIAGRNMLTFTFKCYRVDAVADVRGGVGDTGGGSPIPLNIDMSQS